MKQDVTRLTNERLMKKEMVMKYMLNQALNNNTKTSDDPIPGDCCTVPPGGGSGDPGPGGPTT